MRLSLPTRWVWAAREALRRPWEALLAAGAMFAFVVVFATALLLTQGLQDTGELILAQSPSLVLRRLGAGGWEPVPTAAVEPLQGVRGVTRAQARVWGVVRSGEQAVTVIGAQGGDGPARGQALAGGALEAPVGPKALQGVGGALQVEVVRSLPRELDVALGDVVLLHPEDARLLLGLAPGAASDLAVWVRHESEEGAIGPELERAVGFPVAITTRGQALGATRGALQGVASQRTVLLLPALLALILLAAAAALGQRKARADVGLLKALGWTARDIVGLHAARALVVGLPSVALGWAVAYGLVFWSGLGWAGAWLWGWSTSPPLLQLSAGGAALVLLEVGGLVLAPWLVAALLPALASAQADPEQWLRGQGE